MQHKTCRIVLWLILKPKNGEVSKFLSPHHNVWIAFMYQRFYCIVSCWKNWLSVKTFCNRGLLVANNPNDKSAGLQLPPLGATVRFKRVDTFSRDSYVPAHVPVV